ncbi:MULTISPECIES: ParA family protein [Cyanophyceae]|nr:MULTISPECIES: ParA family protein [Cyanophyceae]ACB00863.1 plasmid partitioning protein, ParA family [Picosynechococcus sp. PCC 7002]SMH58940.1 plasmid segregation oscillating ATPase ParF [Picosynechococcus sp. OG1]SMQ86514.1 plasmid segregation oscillating ATPase ParF [Synechococcus sp. 7002]SMQ86547.1 chromosome partitioning protein [Synechococcus sp. 7002]
MQIITVTGYKGGVGKSTSAIHIAAYLARNQKTILIDGDPNRTALNWSQRGEMPFTVADERQAMRLITGHDFVVIDTPARPNSDDLQELAKGCDLLILPTTPDVVSLEPMLAIANDVEDARYRALLTIVPPYPSKEGETMRNELIANGLPTFQSMIRRSAAFQKAALAGKPVNQMSGRDRIPWNDFEALGKEIMEVLRK